MNRNHDGKSGYDFNENRYSNWSDCSSVELNIFGSIFFENHSFTFTLPSDTNISPLENVNSNQIENKLRDRLIVLIRYWLLISLYLFTLFD